MRGSKALTAPVGILQTNGMTLPQGVQDPVRMCESLSLEESDDIYFPNIPGKKPTRAKALCSTCPFEKDCLLDAIKFDRDGFFSGTTRDERRAMARIQKIVQQRVDDLAPRIEEPTASRPRYLHVVRSPEYHEWMDQVEPDDTEIFELDKAI